MENYKNPIVKAMSEKTLKQILEQPMIGRDYSLAELKIGLHDLKHSYAVLDPALTRVLHGFNGVAEYLMPNVVSSHSGYNITLSPKLSIIEIGNHLSNFFKIEEIAGKPTLLASLPGNWKKLNPDIYRKLTPEIVEELITISDTFIPLKELFQPVIPSKHEYIIVGKEDSPLQVKIWPEEGKFQIINQWERLRNKGDHRLDLGTFYEVEFESRKYPDTVERNWNTTQNIFKIRGSNTNFDETIFKNFIPVDILTIAIEQFNKFHSSKYTISGIIQGELPINRLAEHTPLGTRLYSKGQFNICSIVAFAELNSPENPLKALKGAVKALEDMGYKD